MTVLTRGEVADLKERAQVVNMRFSASIVSDLVETIESLVRAYENERAANETARLMAKLKEGV
jgi:hypothetical protein